MVSWEAEYALPGTTISNALQTNGTLLSPAWADFLTHYQFLVGVSIDGPQEIHDQHRVSADGHGSVRRVMRGIDCLRDAGTECSVLTVVGPHNVQRAQELSRFYEREGVNCVQFMPQMYFVSHATAWPGTYAISAVDYAEFLGASFDL